MFLYQKQQQKSMQIVMLKQHTQRQMKSTIQSQIVKIQQNLTVRNIFINVYYQYQQRQETQIKKLVKFQKEQQLLFINMQKKQIHSFHHFHQKRKFRHIMEKQMMLKKIKKEQLSLSLQILTKIHLHRMLSKKIMQLQKKQVL